MHCHDQELFKRIVRKVAKYCPTLPSRAGCDAFEHEGEADGENENELSFTASEQPTRAYDPRMDPRMFEA